MNATEIGTWAGAVWNALNENGVLEIKQIRKEAKLKEKEVYTALGWLAREDKIVLEENSEKKEILVSLVK